MRAGWPNVNGEMPDKQKEQSRHHRHHSPWTKPFDGRPQCSGNCIKMKRMTIPVLVIHGTSDDTVPIASFRPNFSGSSAERDLGKDDRKPHGLFSLLRDG
jgi:hypothetical protein